MTTERLPVLSPRLDRLLQKRQDLGMPEPGPIDMGVLQTILLDEIAGRLDELGEMTMAIGRLITLMEGYQAKEKFEGGVDTIALSATDSVAVLNLLDRWHYSPLITAYITNDGPTYSVLIALNEPRYWMTIKNSETRTIDHTKARRRIERIYYKCARGETASVRIEGEY